MRIHSQIERNQRKERRTFRSRIRSSNPSHNSLRWERNKVTVSIPNRRNKEKNPDRGKEIKEKKEKNESIRFKSKLSNPNRRREEEDRRDPPEGLAAISTAGRRDVAERDGEPSHSSTSHRRRKGLESSTTERPLDGGALDLE